MANRNEDGRLRRQRARSIAIALALAGLVVLFYVATIVRLGPSALRKGEIRSPMPSAELPTDALCKMAGTC